LFKNSKVVELSLKGSFCAYHSRVKPVNSRERERVGHCWIQPRNPGGRYFSLLRQPYGEKEDTKWVEKKTNVSPPRSNAFTKKKETK